MTHRCPFQPLLFCDSITGGDSKLEPSHRLDKENKSLENSSYEGNLENTKSRKEEKQ